MKCNQENIIFHLHNKEEYLRYLVHLKYVLTLHGSLMQLRGWARFPPPWEMDRDP